MRTKHPAHTLDNSILHEPFPIEPSRQTERNINAIDIEVEHGPLDVFVRMLAFMSIVLFVLYRMVSRMVTNVVPQCGGVDDPAASVKVARVGLRSPCDMYVFERYARVLPLGNDSRLKNDRDSCFRSEIVANRASDIHYAVNSQHRITV